MGLVALVTLTVGLLTAKLVCESHQWWGAFIPNLGTLGLRVLELFAIYPTDGRTDGQKQRLLPLFLRAGHNNRRLVTPAFRCRV